MIRVGFTVICLISSQFLFVFVTVVVFTLLQDVCLFVFQFCRLWSIVVGWLHSNLPVSLSSPTDCRQGGLLAASPVCNHNTNL